MLLQIDQVNGKKDELTIAIKSLADTAKQLTSACGKQHIQLAKLVEELENAGK